MKRPEHRLDKHGFPIPLKFDQEAAAEPQPETAARRGKWALVVLLLLVGAALVAESPLLTVGRRAIANFYLGHADQKHLNGDLPGALADLDAAMEYVHDNPRLYQLRGHWRLDANDLQGSLADFTRVIEMQGTWSPAYVDRGYLYLRMGRPREALDDLNLAVQFRTGRDADMYNARAYGRALAGVDLKEAQEDVEKAIEFDNADRHTLFDAPGSEIKVAPSKPKTFASSMNPEYLDTRGYILYLLGNHDQALDDLNLAIEQSEAEQRRVEKLGLRPGIDKRRLDLALQQCRRTLAVMYHHRGQIHEKRGDSDQAESDLNLGHKLGYNPAAGVF